MSERKNKLLDSEKYTMQKFKAKNLEGLIEEIKEQNILFSLHSYNDRSNIVRRDVVIRKV